MRADDQQASDVAIALPTDPAHALLTAGRALPRDEAQPSGKLTAGAEDRRVGHGGDNRGRDHRPDPDNVWVQGLLARCARLKVAVALANKTARIAWVIMARGETYRRGRSRLGRARPETRCLQEE